jgi:hypothetical protein
MFGKAQIAGLQRCHHMAAVDQGGNVDRQAHPEIEPVATLLDKRTKSHSGFPHVTQALVTPRGRH